MTYQPSAWHRVDKTQVQQTMKWLRSPPDQPGTISEQNALVELFADEYNPSAHAPLPARPERPKDPPARTRNEQHPDLHSQVRVSSMS